MGQEGVQFDTAKFNWIGNPIVDTNVTSLWTALGINSLEEIKSKGGVICGGSGANSSSVTFPQTLNNLFGTKIKIISGYPGGPQMNLALERGEINCRGGGGWASTKATSVELMKDKKITMVLQWGPEKLPEIEEYQGRPVPLVLDLAPTKEDRTTLEFMMSDVTMGRPILTTPDVPAERVTALRRAFDAVMKDKEYLAEAEKQQLNVNPMSGEKLQAFAANAAQTPKSVVARAKEFTTPRDVTEYKK